MVFLEEYCLDIQKGIKMRLATMFSYVYVFLWIFLSFLPFVYYSTKAYVSLLFFFAISALIYTFYFIGNYKLLPYFKCLFVFVAYLSIYGLHLLFLGDDVFWQYANFFIPQNRYILWLLISMLSVIPIYIFTCRGELKECEMKILFFVMLASCVFAFFKTQEQMLLEAALLGSKQDEFTITVVYSFLSILPLVCLFRKNVLLQFILLLIFFVFFILSAKRGAILLGTISVVFIIWGILSNYSIKKKTILFFISLVFLAGLFQFALYQIENSPYLLLRYEDTKDGYSSQRDVFIKIILDYIDKNFSIKSFLFGFGAQKTLSVNISFAHNDWVAILLEQGIIGVFAYLLFWIGFTYTWLKSKSNKESFVVLGTMVIIGLGKTMFSMFYLPVTEIMIISSGFYSITLGYYLGVTYPMQEFNGIKKV